MTANRGSARPVYAVLALAVLYLFYRILSPTEVRDDERAPPVAEVEYGAGASLPADILRVPPAIQLMLGGAHLDRGYWYLPYAVTEEAQGVAMVQSLRAELLRGNGFPEELTVPDGAGAGGRNLLYRNEPGVVRFYTSDLNNLDEGSLTDAFIPLVITQPSGDDHAVDVLFLDGHMASVPVGQFPLSERFLDALSSLDPPDAHRD